jgi:hypothetical protein
MLCPVDPLLHRIEALPRRGAYAVTFVLPDGQERTVVTVTTDGQVSLPAANLVEGWAEGSDSFQAVLAAILAVGAAREISGAGRVLLLDVDGGWDVSIGNIILSESGQPACVSHGDLEPTRPGIFECPTCGAVALFGV